MREGVAYSVRGEEEGESKTIRHRALGVGLTEGFWAGPGWALERTLAWGVFIFFIIFLQIFL
jgi:hypothetical protein|tara:strand:+ start:737 stop:922 length:186 start_codon:yes stop_codon:yes gene_type:complete